MICLLNNSQFFQFKAAHICLQSEVCRRGKYILIYHFTSFWQKTNLFRQSSLTKFFKGSITTSQTMQIFNRYPLKFSAVKTSSCFWDRYIMQSFTTLIKQRTSIAAQKFFLEAKHCLHLFMKLQLALAFGLVADQKTQCQQPTSISYNS